MEVSKSIDLSVRRFVTLIEKSSPWERWLQSGRRPESIQGITFCPWISGPGYTPSARVALETRCQLDITVTVPSTDGSLAKEPIGGYERVLDCEVSFRANGGVNPDWDSDKKHDKRAKVHNFDN
jgi:hypothetical protein